MNKKPSPQMICQVKGRCPIIDGNPCHWQAPHEHNAACDIGHNTSDCLICVPYVEPSHPEPMPLIELRKKFAEITGRCEGLDSWCDTCADNEICHDKDVLNALEDAAMAWHNAEVQQVRKAFAEEIQKYIDENNIYQVIFGHYEDLYKWVPLQTKRINITEVLDERDK